VQRRVVKPDSAREMGYIVGTMTDTEQPVTTEEATTQRVMSAPDRARLYRTLALVVIGALFAFGAWQWVQFGRAEGIPRGLFTQTDFPAVTIASRLIAEGRTYELYSLDAQLEGQRRLVAEGELLLPDGLGLAYPYPYAPFVALAMAPLADAPRAAMAVYDLLNIAGMAVGLWYLLWALPVPGAVRGALLAAGLGSFPFVVNLEQGQSSGLVALALGLGIGLLRRGPDLPGGLALGLLAIKVQWLPFVVLALLVTGRWRALGGMAATGAAMMLGAVAVMGFDWVPGYVDMAGRAGRLDRALLLDPAASHSFVGGVVALFGPGAEGAAVLANLALIAGLGVLMMYRWRREGWRPGTPRWDGIMGLTVAVALLTQVHLNTHDVSLMVVPGALGLACLYASPRSERARYVLYGVLWTVAVGTALFLPQVLGSPLRLTTLALVGLVGVLGWVLLIETQRRKDAKVSY
jgi:hypothetical protein